MNKSRLLGVMGALLLAAQSASALATVVLTDGFNNGALDPLWTVTSSGASGWSYAETSSQFEVYDITDPTVASGWASYKLSYQFDALTDLDVNYNFGWDNMYWFYGSNYPYNTTIAMQGFYVELYDATGSVVIASRYHDGWRDTAGEFDFKIGSTSYHTGQGTSGYQDNSTDVNISRTNGYTTITWDGIQQLSGTTNTEIAGIGITFRYYSHLSGGYYSIFGNESISNLSIEGTLASETVLATPIPAAFWLFSSGLVGLVGISRRKRKA